jgi:hypothetical protein
MKRLILIALAVVAITSCKTQQLYLTITQPAPVTIPTYIKSVGVIDRTTPTEATKNLDNLDKVLSLEGSDLDSVGKRGGLEGLSDELLSNGRFTEVKDLTAIDFRTSSMGAFPLPLSWDIVESLCTDQNTDAVFAMELYDTDTRVFHEPSGGNNATEKVLSAVFEPNTSIETLVTLGWRIYDPRDKVILDEFQMTRSIVTTGSIASTAIALTGRKEAVKKASITAGHDYALRLLPYNIRVTRDYFVKGTNNFKIAKRKAQNGNWDDAGTLWEKETTNSKSKIAGRAAYNMAIINEINGNLEEAIKWAEKSWEDYKTKQGKHYVWILKDRLKAVELLNYQESK